ncbi:aminoacyltransferase [Bifidobacterium pseudolongum]|uniref:Peptidoglycan bridge formation protein FemAB n=1 Tax=Bifidobacterium pseudolongum subsp. globosum TaxID=1690 RepID=A0A2N3QVI7_9BIFI|nr:aminoacyltransferase [Bifidobacterium pseudolongum]MCH4834626.1 aminoacyltransferase [Bifidobacterium pseudolongum]PKU96137.1 peptidoglycan bridge formation protein FemAB [Bifidobacterium pseudolongum subsp. globosum]
MAQATARHWNVRPLRDGEFEQLSQRMAEGSFQQSLGMRDMAQSHGARTSLVGVVDERDEPVAGAMIAYTPSRFGPVGSVWAGPLCDPDDPDMVSAVSEAILEDGRRHHALSISCWPNDVYRRHHSDGSADGAADGALMRDYAHAHWRHQGFGTGYDSVMNRWVYVKDLSGIGDERALLGSYSKRTQWSVKRARSMGVVVREVGEDQFGVFAQIEQQTAERRRFAFRGEQYFHDFARAFGDRAHFMIAYIDTTRYLESMQRKADDLRSLVESIGAKMQARETTKLRRRYNEESSNLAAATKRLQAARELATRGALLPAACSLFVEHPNEVVYLFSGSLEEYKPFYASALIQHEAMLRLCVERGIARYNFYGIDGVFDDPNSEGHGVLEFKQGFNGYVEELPGEFTLPVSRVRCAVKRIAQKVIGG